jgi:hypothetical protein
MRWYCTRLHDHCFLFSLKRLSPGCFVSGNRSLRRFTVAYYETSDRTLYTLILRPRTLDKSDVLQDVRLIEAESRGSYISKSCACDLYEYACRPRLRRKHENDILTCDQVLLNPYSVETSKDGKKHVHLATQRKMV